MLLPTPLAWIKKTLAILKSNLTPNQIALGFALGIFAGLPPMGLHIILPLTLALLVRCSFRSFLISFGLFKLLSIAIAPGAFSIGRWLLDTSRGLDAFWRWVFHLPVLAPMGYGRYLLLGGLVLALVLAIPVFFAIRLGVGRYRTSFAERVSKWTISKRLKQVRGLGILRWAFAGGSAKYASKKPPRGILRFIRREMLIGLPIVYAACYLLAAVIVPFFAGTLATSTASWVVGSKVAVADSSFSLFSGTLHLEDFSVQDPKKPSENLVEIPSIQLDARMVALVDKRVVFDRVVIADASLHVVREEDGTLNLDNATSGWNAEGYVAWAAEHAKNVDWLGLLRQLIRYLSDLRPLAPRDDPYAPYRGGRSFPDYVAPFAVKRLDIGRVLLTLEDRLDTEGPLPEISLLEIEIANLAFPRALRHRPIEVTLRGVFDDGESGFSLSARFQEGPTPSSTFSATLHRVDLARIATLYRTTLPVDVRSGRATLEAEVRLSGPDASGDVSLILEDLEIAGRSNQPLFGLPQQTSDQVIEGLNRYAFDLPIVIGFPIGGTTESPTLEWEASLLAVARDGLMMLGRRQLESTIEELTSRIGVLGGVDASALPQDYEDLRSEAERAAVGIIESAAGDFIPEIPGLTPQAQTESSNPLERLLDRILQIPDEPESP